MIPKYISELSLKTFLIISLIMFTAQQNVPIPPRPSSSQSDCGAPSRMSLSPLATSGL